MKKKNIVITGASSGIGRALAYCYDSQPCNLGLIGRDLNRLAQISSILENDTFSRVFFLEFKL